MLFCYQSVKCNNLAFLTRHFHTLEHCNCIIMLMLSEDCWRKSNSENTGEHWYVPKVLTLAQQCLKITLNVALEFSQFWHFPPIFVLLNLTRLVTLFDRKLQVFKNSPKWTIFGIFNLLLSTQNVNVARLAPNVEWDFFCEFQTPWLFSFFKELMFTFLLERWKNDHPSHRLSCRCRPTHLIFPPAAVQLCHCRNRQVPGLQVHWVQLWVTKKKKFFFFLAATANIFVMMVVVVILR